jgi:hypothetical protein
VRLEAADQDGLEQLPEFVMRHLEGHADGEQRQIDWRPGTPGAGADDPVGGWERMRELHRRARRSKGAR